MSKVIVLNLKSLKYSGNSIGDDIRIEIEISGQTFNFKKKIANGSEHIFDKIITEVNTDKENFETGINLKIIEDDPVFNDVRDLKTNIKIDTTKNNIQKFSYEIKIKELKNNLTRSNAVFTLEIEAEIKEAEMYLPEIFDGWLKTKILGLKEDISLPAFLRVKFIKTEENRDHFIILEGPYMGKKGSIKKDTENKSYLKQGNLKRDDSIYATYSISKKVFSLNGKKYSATDYKNFLWTKGLYDIEIPDYPHEGGRIYLKKSKRAMTWFKIGHSGDRYSHAGGRSLGCMTVIEIDRWMEIYNELIKARKGDGKSVGILEVID